MTKLNNYLPLLPGSGNMKKMEEEELKKSCSMPFLTSGTSRRIYKAGTYGARLIGKPMRCLSKWISLIKSNKGKRLLKQPTGQIPSVMDTSGNVRE